MARCTECGFDWELLPDDLITEVGTFGVAYRACLTRFLDGENADNLVRSRPAPGVWSALEYTAHMRDVLSFYTERIRGVLAEDRPTMAAADFASMADERRYDQEDVTAVLDAVDQGASSASTLLASLAPDDWARVGIGSGGDERTVLVLTRRLVHDGHHHLLDVGRVLRQVRDRD